MKKQRTANSVLTVCLSKRDNRNQISIVRFRPEYSQIIVGSERESGLTPVFTGFWLKGGF